MKLLAVMDISSPQSTLDLLFLKEDHRYANTHNAMIPPIDRTNQIVLRVGECWCLVLQEMLSTVRTIR